MRKIVAGVLAGVALLALTPCLPAQEGFFTREDVIKYTPDWHGERFPDGRPKVPDDILDRMKNVTLEEAWATLRSAGFNHQYEDGWYCIHPDQVLVGRALTAVWMPGRPDVQKVIEDQGAKDNRKGATNAWPVDMLQPRDVYVADHFGLKQDGPSIGDNVGNAIYARSGNGIVYDGAVRDINGLNELPNFTSFVRYYDPSHHFGTLSSGPAAELHHGQHQWSDPHWTCAGDAGRCCSGTKRRRALHSAATGGTSRQGLGTHPSRGHVRPPAPAGKEVYRRTDRCQVVAGNRTGLITSG